MHQETMKSPLKRNHQFPGARAALPLEEKDRVGREKEKIIITHRNYGLKSSTFFGYSILCYKNYKFFLLILPLASLLDVQAILLAACDVSRRSAGLFISHAVRKS